MRWYELSGSKRQLVRGLGCTWLLIQITACGHLGIDLDGVDASVTFDASDDKDGGSSHTKPSKTEESKPDKTETNDESTSGSENSTNTGHGSLLLDGGSNEGEAGLELDASRDGSVDTALDGAADSSVDASLPNHTDAGTSGAQSSTEGLSDVDGGTGTDVTTAVPIPDDNAYTCDPLCQCGIDEECELVCKSPDCAAACDEGGECKVQSGESTTVTVDCAFGAKCDTAGSAPVVHVICKGEGECQATCLDGQKCDVDCAGAGKCIAQCLGNATCHVNCGDSSECYISHDTTAIVDLQCAETNVECGEELVTCHGACP